MRSAKRQPTLDEVQAVVDANPDKVQSFKAIGPNGYLMNQGRYNGLGIIYALDHSEYLKFYMVSGSQASQPNQSQNL
jgi:hypothetical protein